VLKEMGVDAKLYVCENFGYPEERIAGGTVDEPPQAESVLHCVVVVRK
jgi:cobalt-precorrin-7 (C5)-methyltransferase